MHDLFPLWSILTDIQEKMMQFAEWTAKSLDCAQIQTIK
jgi:hypothetical protein